MMLRISRASFTQSLDVRALSSDNRLRAEGVVETLLDAPPKETPCLAIEVVESVEGIAGLRALKSEEIRVDDVREVILVTPFADSVPNLNLTTSLFKVDRYLMYGIHHCGCNIWR